jgi:hypothetical protein
VRRDERAAAFRCCPLPRRAPARASASRDGPRKASAQERIADGVGSIASVERARLPVPVTDPDRRSAPHTLAAIGILERDGAQAVARDPRLDRAGHATDDGTAAQVHPVNPRERLPTTDGRHPAIDQDPERVAARRGRGARRRLRPHRQAGQREARHPGAQEDETAHPAHERPFFNRVHNVHAWTAAS